MRDLLRQRNRKGVSVMVGYVLLIIIAVSLSIGVYAYLKLYLPSEEPECLENVEIVIESLSCTHGLGAPENEYSVGFTVTNRGLFSADGAFVRIGIENRIYREVISAPFGHRFMKANGPGSLLPGETIDAAYKYNNSADGLRELEIQPFIYVDSKAAVCKNAVVSERVNCVSA